MGIAIFIIVLECGTVRNLEIISKEEPDLRRSMFVFLVFCKISLNLSMMLKREATYWELQEITVMTKQKYINLSGISQIDETLRNVHLNMKKKSLISGNP